MCLAIPGRIVEHVDEPNQLAKVDVAGVRRTVNIGLLNDVGPGDWVLIHVGFAISQVDEAEAHATLALLQEMGAEYEQELAELQGSASSELRARALHHRAATSPKRCASLEIDAGRELALCAAGDQHTTVEIGLVTPLEPGDTVLVHAGVALTVLA